MFYSIPPVLFCGSGSRVLTNSSNTASFPAGYYSAFTVSTNIASLPGTVSYTYHHHSLTATNYSTGSASGGSYSDSYHSATKGGCFTAPVYKAHQHKTANGSVSTATYSTTKGGCYNAIRYTAHTHTGSSTSGGGCYTKAKYYIPYYEEDYDWVCHGGWIVHESDGKDACSECGHGYHGMEDKTIHDHRRVEAHWSYENEGGRATSVTYELNCNNLPLNSSPVYDLNCGKTAGTRYSAEGIDYYTRTCGKVDGQITSATIVY